MAEYKPVTREETIRILEDIIRNPSNGAARIAAIKQLEAMRRGASPEAEDSFTNLDEVGLKRQARQG